MRWFVFTYSLPGAGQSSARVTLWRRLQRLGALPLGGAVYLLPARPECLEGFQWLAQEVRQAGGEAGIMHVDRFEDLSDAEVVERFHAARREEYTALHAQVSELEQQLDASSAPARAAAGETLEKLRKRHAELLRIDFFDSPDGVALAARLQAFGQRLLAGESPAPGVKPADRRAFQGRVWVTRPKPHVDRLASAWLIRRFIDPEAAIRYRTVVGEDEVSFDMPAAQFGHTGPLCTFETLVAAFALDDPALPALAEIVHEIDLRDGRYARPETAGLDALLDGWRELDLTDQELEWRGIALFEGLYTAMARRREAAPTPDAAQQGREDA